MGVDIFMDLNLALERYRANRIYNKEAIVKRDSK